MATRLLYLEDFGILSSHAKVVDVTATDDGRTRVALDQTPFYPRGGGQDWDTGVIKAGTNEFIVEEVRLDEQGIVQHIGHFNGNPFTAGTSADCFVDAERRKTNTRLHSAGHMVDLSVDRLTLSWVPGRGAHYSHMSFVEYQGELAPEQIENVREQIETIANEVIARGAENEIRFMPVSEMHAVCRHVPENIPTNKPARVVIYCGDFGVPCGGTHVKNLNEIGRVSITKLKSKKGIIKVSYAVEGIN
jgi:Ser-tRNA(Ala) deacylase AlaX